MFRFTNPGHAFTQTERCPDNCYNIGATLTGKKYGCRLIDIDRTGFANTFSSLTPGGKVHEKGD
jgi:hypothetical protein